MLTIQTVLYENDPAAIRRFLAALAVTVREFHGPVLVLLGDCSARPLLSAQLVDQWRQECGAGDQLDARYTFFEQNLGFGKGHNRLRRASTEAERLLVVNPDALVAPHLLSRLSRVADAHPDWGAVEARQVPIEHSKGFDSTTWETPWVTGACILIDGPSFDALGGFDETFFLYAEDVDLSWRLRGAGKRLYYCPDTFLMHAKRLANGAPIGSEAERIFGRVGLLLLRDKYGRSDLNERMLALLRTDPRPVCQRTVSEYDRMAGRLPPVTEAERAAATFTPQGTPSPLRWTYPLPAQMLTAG
jgi:hypothetical protein